jgi:hypothetical protein
VGTPSLEARNIRLVNIITYIIEESKLISENMSPNVIHRENFDIFLDITFLLLELFFKFKLICKVETNI